MNYKKIKTIGVITPPIVKAGNTPLSNLLTVLNPLSEQIYLITGGNFSNHVKNVQVKKIKVKESNDIVSKIIRNISIQIIISREIFKQKNVNLWIFFLDAHSFLLPVLTSKILSNKTIFLLAASIRKSNNSQKKFLDKFLILSEYFNFKIANVIIVYSKNIIKDWELGRYEDKIYIAHEHILNFNEFKLKKNYNTRNNLIGFVGRLSGEKGIIEFLNAISIILNENDDLDFIICGDGNLKEEVNSYLDNNNLHNKVKLLGWVSHEDLPDILNDSKLLVLPSYSEGLPNVMLEAMACGTPVLATPVGSIPDILHDGKNGFIMENNYPKTISENIIRAINFLEGNNQLNTREFIEKKFQFDNTILEWKNLILELNNSES